MSPHSLPSKATSVHMLSKEGAFTLYSQRYFRKPRAACSHPGRTGIRPSGGTLPWGLALCRPPIPGLATEGTDFQSLPLRATGQSPEEKSPKCGAEGFHRWSPAALGEASSSSALTCDVSQRSPFALNCLIFHLFIYLFLSKRSTLRGAQTQDPERRTLHRPRRPGAP